MDELDTLHQRIAELEQSEKQLRQVEKDLRRRSAELEGLRLASLSVTSSLELQPVLEALLEHTLQLVAANDAHIFLYDGETLTFGAALWADRRQEKPFAEIRPQGLTYTVARTGKRAVIGHVDAHPLFRDWPWGGAIVGMPLHIGERTVGVMNVAFDQIHDFDESELRVLELLADQAAIAIENARLFDETRRRATHQEALNAVIAAATTTPNLLDLLETALEHTLQTLDLETGAIWVPDLYVSKGIFDVDMSPAYVNRMIETTSAVPIVVSDWQNQDLPAGLAELANRQGHLGIQAFVIVALRTKTGLLGGLTVTAKLPRTWSQEEIALLEAIGQQLSGAAERLHLLKRVQEQARQVQQIVDTVPQGVLLLDADRQVVLTNPAGREYLALLAQVDIGEKLTHLGNQSLTDLIKASADMAPKQVVVGKPRQRRFEIESRPMESTPQTGGWVLVIRDVTHMREMQERIGQQERLAAIGRLAAGIAHDFNNILQSMIMNADLLAQDPTLPTSPRETAQTIIQQGNRGALLIRQILDFGRKSISLRQSLELAPFTQATIEQLRLLTPENLHLEFQQQAGEFLIQADPNQVEQVLTNLIINARDAMPTGGRVEIRLSRLTLQQDQPGPFPNMPPGDWVVLTVADTGPGIPSDILPRIFEPFFTTKKVGEGTGLGLAQVYGIVKQHDGQIQVESHVGEGTTFNIYLPAHPTV